jgi:hypothetical protein
VDKWADWIAQSAEPSLHVFLHPSTIASRPAGGLAEDAFVAFMNVLTDLERRCDARPMPAQVPAAEMGVIV